ncbi:zinc ribbon domain-containing protein, partial [Candidatus Similichlamydia epinepheli]|uniref:zinc ribbon domain-containing protein n=1 Tax=Candidatus Similichlamydia epinepheli TaxID=1903953 RepID=UPI001EFD2616
RDKLASEASSDILPIYERLIRHKGDSVVVTIENRACSGCNIIVTAQHENLVRRADRVVFCEHCSRIHYWQDVEESVDLLSSKKRRRRIQSVV